MSERIWILKDEKINSETIYNLMKNLNCGYLLASVLAARGVTKTEEAQAFITFKEMWHDPLMLPDMAIAINRLKSAKSKNEYVAVFGDYDADGITATVIMKNCLEEFGLKVCKYIPDRNIEGYGMSKDAVDKLHAKGVNLIVTVDCGISCREEIAYASMLGIDTIVTDHHTCPDILPDCCAVINPKRKDSVYPYGCLAGAGVAYKFACALIGFEKAEKYLEYAAIGTVADVVELNGENRKIVKEGLNIINTSPSKGIEALLLSASKASADSTTVSFIIAPRINCAGRIESPETAYKLLISQDIEKATEYTGKLNELNRKRQKTEQDIYDEAVNEIKRRGLYNDKVIVVGGYGWNPGVIGIVAAKITERIYKPCILIAYGNDSIGRASGRSIEGFDLFEAIKFSGNFLLKYGGHAQAAGLSIEKENEEIFRKKINDYAEKALTKDLLVKKIYIDSLLNTEAVTVKNIDELSKLEPFGTGNEKPIFAFVNAKISDIKELSEGKHLKLVLKKDDFSIDAIAFGYGGAAKKLYKGMVIHSAGNLEINDYTGRVQLVIKDILY